MLFKETNNTTKPIKQKRLFAIVVVFLCAASLFAGDPEKIQWITIQEAEELSKTKPKKIIVDIYTDWCGWCKKMDAATYSNDSVIRYINKQFYAIKYNAESRDTVAFNGFVFRYLEKYKANEFAVSLLNGKMTYPSTVWLDEEFTLLSPVSGFLQPDIFLKISKFYGDNYYKTISWKEFETPDSKTNVETTE